ncbi:hypothetical protein HMPREF1071_01995 [Bacteroides salyersiae CL02T12C01]|jgi:hypothetical protein|uniref:Uncharacterized protein n=1 Tax=Bacteroides salyersiae CL02T12C01 TaxID=997887 RepID=I9HWJ1_9BACE|nr:hypothetical protein HMPREF1071_01995 [Bacteroides salyersiae CL02T12C01]
MLRHHFSIKPGYQNIRMLSHKTWGCSYMQHGDVVHENIPMFLHLKSIKKRIINYLTIT